MDLWTVGRLPGPRRAGPTLELSAGAARDLELEPGGEVTVSAGGLGTRATLVVRSGPDARVLWASRSLLEALHLPAGIRLAVLRVPGPPRGLRLGPVVGIFCTRGRRSLFGGQTPIIREMTRLALTVGVLAFGFTPGGVGWDRRTVRGYVFRGSRGWRVARFPFPDVVYSRLPSRRAERLPRVSRTVERLRERLGDCYFNPCFLDKWETYQALCREPRIVPLLPDTRRYHGPPGLLEMLDRYPVLYLKPTAGSQGRGIIRLVRRWPAACAWQYQGARGIRGGEARTQAELGRAMARLMRGRRYMMQEGLDLARVGGRPFDVRVLMQKDERGRWRRTKVFARLGATGGITSNISTGGTGEALGRVVPLALARSRPARRRELARRLRETASWLAPLVEQALAMNLGELGLDIGVDRRGRLWLIEVNSRPWRNVTTERGSMALVRLALARPLTYARHLAGFGPGASEEAGAAGEETPS